MRSLFTKSSRTTLAVAIIVCSAGVAMAASGVVSLAATGDGSNATARQAQAPLGVVSATPPVGSSPASGALEVTPTGKGSAPESAASNPASTPSDTVKNATAQSDSGTSLPFTGFLAIPILLVGVALLGAGVAAGRRITAQAQAV